MKKLKVTKLEGDGQAQCKGCKGKGKWNVSWCCFFYKIEGRDGAYCKDCVAEITGNEDVKKETAICR